MENIDILFRAQKGPITIIGNLIKMKNNNYIIAENKISNKYDNLYFNNSEGYWDYVNINDVEISYDGGVTWNLFINQHTKMYFVYGNNTDSAKIIRENFAGTYLLESIVFASKSKKNISFKEYDKINVGDICSTSIGEIIQINSIHNVNIYYEHIEQDINGNKFSYIDRKNNNIYKTLIAYQTNDEINIKDIENISEGDIIYTNDDEVIKVVKII